VRQEADEGLSQAALSAIFLAVIAMLLPILVVLERVCRPPKGVEKIKFISPFFLYKR
jgi:hypothetical protein